MGDEQARTSSGPDAPEAAAPTVQPATGDVADAANWSKWSNLWQIPALLVGMALIAGGIYLAASRSKGNDFDGALDQIEKLMAMNQLEDASTRLHKVVEPNLNLATPEQTARFHALVADWIHFTQREQGSDEESNNKQITEHYGLAVELGAALSADRLERWAEALIAIGDLSAARGKLAQLDSLVSADAAHAEDGQDALSRRNRVMRRLVEVSLRQPSLSADAMIQVLGDYRTDPKLAAEDDAWAAARQAELRLNSGHPDLAVDRLLIDMRRIEMRLSPGQTIHCGELYTLLGRGYLELGDSDEALFHLNRALADFQGAEPARGEAMVLLGQIAVAAGELNEAHDRFDAVVRDFANTPAFAPGLLGRAEVRSVLGDHEQSLADYEQLLNLHRKGPTQRDPTSERLGRSLADRHDAALASGKLDVAVKYIDLAEQCFKPTDVPDDVLLRIASISRQVADNRLAIATNSHEGAETDDGVVTPAERLEANLGYKRAGEYYLRHARAVAGLPNEDHAWSDSLWMSADSFDRGGWHELAVAQFKEYVASSATTDPRRTQAVFRLAQACQAQDDFSIAVQYYEQLIADQPRSPFASASHVPLARCYLALERRPEAEEQLMEVLAGHRNVGPEAVDYREALLELGKLYYDNAQYVRAIEELDKAVAAFAGDQRLNEIHYRLADSYLKNSHDLQDKIAKPELPRAEALRLTDQRREQLQTAMSQFGVVIDVYEKRVARPLDRSEQDLLRFAFLSRADCAYLLGEFDKSMFEAAIGLYDQAARKYSNHVSSMTALVQIVNCYYALNDMERAKAAQQRAQTRLEQLPDDAFDAPDALLDRQAWQQWLRNSPLEIVSTNSEPQEPAPN